MHFWYCSHLVITLVVFVCVHGQKPNYDGFINIDCGLESGASYVHDYTGLKYVSDDNYINAGIKDVVPSQYSTNRPDYAGLNTFRKFPDGTKNCYTLKPVTRGLQYMVRATFYYWNLDKFPQFNLHFGGNFWATVGIFPDHDYSYEIIAIAPTNYIEVCLVKTGSGVPYISALELRPLNNSHYNLAGPKPLLLNRFWKDDDGWDVKNYITRFPEDVHDGLWLGWMGWSDPWTALSTNLSIQGSDFDVPSSVLQTAAIPSTGSQINMEFGDYNSSTIYFVVLHFAEVQILRNTSLREFYIYSNGALISTTRPQYLSASSVSYNVSGLMRHKISLQSTPRATLPPIINAMEIYTILPTNDADIHNDVHNTKEVNIITVGVVIALLTAGAAALFFCYRMKNKKQKTSKMNFYDSTTGAKGLNFDKKQFTFEELRLITNDFSNEIGIGGFGKVFKGYLQTGEEVAVKVRAETSSQGIEQFMNEVELLSKIHHKNLVSLIGYCKDSDHIALVYEYMQEGSLENHIRGYNLSLPWKERLQISYESAQVLNYLHTMCNPTVIHRDIKTSNILLTKNLEAKISDFGLVRAFTGTHVTTQVVGTPGYLDPYYASSLQLNEKSDVYSFGVVLLEIITGKSPIIQGRQHITQFVRQKLSKGNIESIVDQNMQDKYNLNSIWKVTELALSCASIEPDNRPDMAEVVSVLKECLCLENSSVEISRVNPENTRQNRADNLFGDSMNSGNTGIHVGNPLVPDSDYLIR